MGPMRDMCHHLIGRKSKVMDKMIRKSKGANRMLTCGKGGHSHLIMLDETGGEEGEKRKRRKKEEREATTSLYDLWRSVGRFSSSQVLKIICSTKASRGYRKHEISPRIQVKSSRNQGFRV